MIGVEEGQARSGGQHLKISRRTQCDSDDSTMPLCKACRIDVNVVGIGELAI